MDKSSFFFTANCGICHPGGAAMQYDRAGNLYFDRATGLYGFGGGVATLPASPAGSPPSGAQLDGDYGFINPSTGVPGTANWAKTGVSEADCLMCHMTRYATAPGTASQNAGLSWHKRAGSLRGISAAGVASFEVAPTAGAGWASVAYVAGQSPPMASGVTVDYALGVAAGTLVVDGSGNLAIAPGVFGTTKDANCRGCHSIPDGKKTGRTLLPITDAHVAKGVGCTRCHATPNDGVADSLGLAMSNPHQIGKGDITIGSVRNDLDGTVKDCAECHLGGADPLAPDPTPKHAAIPAFHYSFMKCQVCHIRHLDDDPVSPTQDIPDLVIEMSSNGTQNTSIWSAYLGTDPLDPSRNLPELSGKPFRWYPGVRWYKGKLQTVKPLYTAWFGEWLSGSGDSAVIRPVPLRLVRKALTGGYAPGTARSAALTLTPGTKVATGAPILHKKAEIEAFLVALRDAADTANPDATANDIVTRPVLVRADRVYFLNDSGQLEFFESLVGESHDFAVNHNVVTARDPANPVVSPGPYGAGGCGDCHAPGSPFFYTKQLAEPAQYDFLDEHGTVPNPDAGKPRYVSHYEAMGYPKLRADTLTGTSVPVMVEVYDSTGRVTFGEQGQPATECRSASGCSIGATPGSTVTFTAAADPGSSFLGWTGCTPGPDPLSCTVTVGTPASGLSNPGVVVHASFGAPPAPPPATYPLTLSYAGTGTGSATIQVDGAAVAWDACGATGCTREVPNGAAVTLHGVPGTGMVFDGWGIVCAGTADCSFAMNASKTASAEFSPQQYSLAVTLGGTGPGRVAGGPIDCTRLAGSTCSASVDAGTSVTLTATWDPALASFTGWSGGCTGAAASCTVTMSVAKTVTATFQPASYLLTTTVSGAGTVSGTGLSCASTAGVSTTCTAQEASGASIVLTAEPAQGAIFKGWSGCSSVSGTSCTVKMLSAKTVAATFQPATYPLTVSIKPIGGGTVTGTADGVAFSWASCGPNPKDVNATACTADVANGASVSLNASPSSGFTFKAWGAVCTGTGACSFKMNGPKSPTATFSSP